MSFGSFYCPFISSIEENKYAAPLHQRTIKSYEVWSYEVRIY